MNRLSLLVRVALSACAAAAISFIGAPSAWAKGAGPGDPLQLDVPGHADAFYYQPTVRGQQPILMFLHGRGGNPAEDCRKWARVATQFGWVVCPQGPEDRGGGARGWGNNPVSGKSTIDSVVQALRAKYKSRVQLRNNVLIGFSEGSFIAMQVGIKDPRTWDRWLILAANDQYWWGEENKHLLEEGRKRIQRVYLYTGQNDEVAENTKRVEKMLRDAKIPVRMNIVSGLGHEVPADRMVTNYRRPLLWLMAAKKP
ncbi:hypothetical protein LVJ94_40845 [Pendulispora rubella]|uniref:Uncharacterized protein n=1 Tax=Pendulispora rubella TaxID=2741070 RepID=A0ABZ2L1X9_9BACT